MELVGNGVRDKNIRFRLYAISLAGICAFGSVMYWRSATLMAADYQDVPVFAYEKGRRKPKSARAANIEKAMEDEETTKKKIYEQD